LAWRAWLGYKLKACYQINIKISKFPKSLASLGSTSPKKKQVSEKSIILGNVCVVCGGQDDMRLTFALILTHFIF
jgi:hypothetical protein